jgi:aminopeptidase N
VRRVELEVDLDFAATEVRARLELERDPAASDADLRLDGVGLELLWVTLDGVRLGADDYTLEPGALTLPARGERAVVESLVRITPEANTELQGLYRSGAFLLTQCEAEGFRRISWFTDRPDVMARYTVTLRADRERFPVLLANGNLAAAGDDGNGRHWARWVDPHPKPSYLFALVAGRLERRSTSYTTAEGRAVEINLWAEADSIERCKHALDCIVRAMRWDEERFGRSYDLDVFNVVATQDFNMGAMENKGLNVFNAKYVVADLETATDDDFLHVESVIGHEYFHNWSGNRVTCRDWFQLSLKEGLTVYRDQEFTADLHSRALKRVDDVRTLRAQQFTEDAGTFAHPVRPESYLEINNFYTATVYEKGAEIVRMLATVLGAEGFRRGLDLYFARHDGQAVTCDDFVAALADANGRDLSAYLRWYAQAGTPRLVVRESHDAARGRYTLTLSQYTPPTPGQSEKQPLPIPVRLMLYAGDGTPLPLRLEGSDAAPLQRVLVLEGAEQRFEFVGLAEAPVASLLQDFSAPVLLEREIAAEPLAFLARQDRDPFNRWEAMQRLAEQVLAVEVTRRGDGARLAAFEQYLRAARDLLADPDADAAWAAECLALPDEAYLAERLEHDDPTRVHDAREALAALLGARLDDALRDRYLALRDDDGQSRAPRAIGRRRLKHVVLGLLLAADRARYAELARGQLEAAANMTDRLGALTLLAHRGVAGSQALADAFYRRYRGDALVVDKWLALQASNPQPGTLERVERLTEHAAFNWRNPNKVRALVGAFARLNRVGFHAIDGAGYRFVGAAVLKLDPLNPQIAARLATAFSGWRRLEPVRRGLMRTELERLAAAPRLSPDVGEIVSRALA